MYAEMNFYECEGYMYFIYVYTYIQGGAKRGS